MQPCYTNNHQNGDTIILYFMLQYGDTLSSDSLTLRSSVLIMHLTHYLINSANHYLTT